MNTHAHFHIRTLAPGAEPRWVLVSPDGQALPEPQRFVRGLLLRGLSACTARAYSYDLLCAYRWMAEAGLQPHQLREDQLLEFIAFQRRAPSAAASTINRRLRVLQRFVGFLGGPGSHKSPAPAGPVRFRRGPRGNSLRVKEPQRVIEPLRDHQFLAFYASLRTWRDRAMVLLMWAEGLRSFEVLGLRLCDVQFAHRSLRIHGKGDKERVMPLAEPLAHALTHYLGLERPRAPTDADALFVVLKAPGRGRPLSLEGLRRIFRYHREHSGIASANPHRLRHSFAANMTRLRVPLLVLAKMMGHSSPHTTMRYVQIDDHQLRELYEQALAQLLPPDPPYE